MKNTTHDRYFRTSSFYAATFLLAKDQTLVNVDRTVDPKRVQFVFLNSPELEALLRGYNYDEEGSTSVMVDARKFVTAIKMLIYTTTLEPILSRTPEN